LVTKIVMRAMVLALLTGTLAGCATGGKPKADPELARGR
jgi:predicted small lipoprotein YifL